MAWCGKGKKCPPLEKLPFFFCFSIQLSLFFDWTLCSEKKMPLFFLCFSTELFAFPVFFDWTLCFTFLLLFYLCFNWTLCLAFLLPFLFFNRTVCFFFFLLIFLQYDSQDNHLNPNHGASIAYLHKSTRLSSRKKELIAYINHHNLYNQTKQAQQSSRQLWKIYSTSGRRNKFCNTTDFRTLHHSAQKW